MSLENTKKNFEVIYLDFCVVENWLVVKKNQQ